MFFHACVEMCFYSHNLKTWVSICTLSWNENFYYEYYTICGYLNFTGIDVISKNMYLLRMSSYFHIVLITCFRWAKIYQKGWRKRLCCFYSCFLMSLFSLMPGHVSPKLESFSFRAIENLVSEIYKDTVHLVLYLRHFQLILLFPFSRSLTKKRT